MTTPLRSTGQFVQAAGEFCHVVDQFGSFAQDTKGWIEQIGRLLLRLEAAIEDLPDCPFNSSGYSMLADLEQRFVLYRKLKEFLDPLDEYWSEADLLAGDGIKTGSLCDDITDIYFDLKRGLDLYRSGTSGEQQAIQLWLESYHLHWRQHLVDARKQLFEFRITYRSAS